MSKINSTFSEELRAQIARKQLTSGDLVSILNKSKASVSRLVNGERAWTLEDAAVAADWAGLELSEFWGKSA